LAIRSEEADSNLRNMPEELAQFLQREAFSLVIKGKAGTGKTSLALSILTGLIQKQNCLYISSRLAISELFQYHPWVREFVPDTKQVRSSEPDEATQVGPFVDARLDEPSALFERITNELMDMSYPLIIIDTWDAVGDFMDKEALFTNAKILQIWRQRAKAKLVFVLENVEDKTFDTLVDGVIELEEKYVDSRKTRRIHLLKLRGVKISRPLSFFTLDGGLFRSFRSYEQMEPLISTSVGRSRRNGGPAGQYLYDDNSNVIDDLLRGKLPEHSVVSLELDPLVSSKTALGFSTGIVSGYAKKSNIVILPPAEIADVYVEQFSNILHERGEVKVLKNPLLSGKQPNELLSGLEKTIFQVKQKRRKSPLLGVFSLGSSFNNGEVNLESLESMITSNFDATVFISHSNEKVAAKIAEIADIRLKMRDLEGTLFIQPEKPWASFYAVENDETNAGISVEPMV
jgi:KaiC/GvpD/RAD55 family RecA-like ATPase